LIGFLGFPLKPRQQTGPAPRASTKPEKRVKETAVVK